MSEVSTLKSTLQGLSKSDFLWVNKNMSPEVPLCPCEGKHDLVNRSCSLTAAHVPITSHFERITVWGSTALLFLSTLSLFSLLSGPGTAWPC
jgi:hypothetical protein